MKSTLALLCLLVARLSFGSYGAINSVYIDTNGWSMLIAVASAATNGNWNFGMTVPPQTNWNCPQPNILTNPPIALTVTSLGYNTAGSLTTIQRTIYGTIQVRLPYPNATNFDQAMGSGVITNRIALSEYVWQTDSNLTVNIAQNWYNDGTVTNSAASNFVVTNNSIANAGHVIANWSWPGFQCVTTTNETLRALAFHSSAQYGNPVAAVKFWVTDNHGHGVTNIVTSMTIDNTIPDANPVPEYIAQMNLSALTSGDQITNFFTAYPWVGNTNSVTDASDGINAVNTPCYSSRTAFYSTNFTYGLPVAVVDPTNGADASGRVLTNWSLGGSIGLFSTINGAAAAVAASNNTWYAHNDCVGSTIYLTNGTYAWMGGSISSGTNGFGWAEVAAYPGVRATNVFLSTVSGNNIIGNKTWVHGVTINHSSGNMFQGGGYVWFDQCVINVSAVALIYSDNGWWVTDCTIPQLPQGLNTYSSQSCPCMLTRGCDLTGNTTGGRVYTVVGNTAKATSANNTASWSGFLTGQITPDPLGLIFAYNTFYRQLSSSEPYLFWDISTNAFGAAIVQNVLEGCYNSATSPLCGFAGDGSEAPNVNNILEWYNTIVGQRCNQSYVEYGASNVWKLNWSVAQNIFSAYNIKSDTFGGGPPNGVRIGNWSQVYGVGNYNNFQFNLSGQGNQLPEWFGLNSYAPWTNTATGFPSSEPPSGVTNVYSYAGFVTFAAWTGGATGTGGGNYKLLSSSPAILTAQSANFFPQSWKLPFDITGAARGMFDPPGSYISTPKRGNAFLAQ